MKIDEDLIIGVKYFIFICAIISIIFIIFMLVGFIVKTADNYTRENNKKDIDFWASKGCVLVDIKFDQPVYKCEEKK